ncbi:TPA: phosphoglycerate kinase [Candidatus Berkelbacteria bacterium]|uniref:Phosphoglycerate kinase n=1 Tax=Berkelbacteria bacterium GW2011_GWE1_39_12 TaxID=1618337 RepID=A0A0G4B315_9BACT|nr:MAG: phosphoglycerate kinase, phosphoglycerate kinase [Berkelbacteria bacterium GW2011_GWE1_39_12]HBO60631.1 phosphoglycerate kinase [Candidatus Berkelbacteria bacterium]
MKKIHEVEIQNKNILIRIDTDVPIENGKVKNDRRLRASLKTLKYLLENNAKVTIIGHIGRPDGEDPELKIRPVEDKLIELLGTHQNWQILENLRFNKGEEENDPDFARQLAVGQDLFVQDAFATCHRSHASTVGIAKLLPSFAGFSVQHEIENLEKISKDKEKPFTVILGGAKIADKLPVLKNLTSRTQNFLIGGAIGSTFLAARRHHLGESLVEEEAFRDANIVWQSITDEPDRNIFLPIDLVISHSIKKAEGVRVIKTSETLDPETMKEYAIDDIGPKTVEEYKKVIAKSKVIFWNGNMGITEVPAFADGSKQIAEAVAGSEAFSVIGGGDTVGFIENIGLADKVSFCSTGGGATLEYISGKDLPGLKALE